MALYLQYLKGQVFRQLFKATILLDQFLAIPFISFVAVHQSIVGLHVVSGVVNTEVSGVVNTEVSGVVNTEVSGVVNTEVSGVVNTEVSGVEIQS